MDLGIVIMGVACTLICILPFVWLHRMTKKEEKKLIKSLTDLAAKHDCTMLKYETLSDFAVGIDANKNCVFFYKKSKDEEVAEFIDLSNIKTCKVVNSNTTFNRKDGIQKVIEKLELSFVPAVESKPAIVLEFYDQYKNVQLSGELQLIERWANLINDQLKKAK